MVNKPRSISENEFDHNKKGRSISETLPVAATAALAASSTSTLSSAARHGFSEREWKDQREREIWWTWKSLALFERVFSSSPRASIYNAGKGGEWWICTVHVYGSYVMSIHAFQSNPFCAYFLPRLVYFFSRIVVFIAYINGVPIPFKWAFLVCSGSVPTASVCAPSDWPWIRLSLMNGCDGAITASKSCFAGPDIA